MKKTTTVRGRLAQGFAISSVIALTSAWGLQPIEAQIPQLSPQDPTGAIESLSAPGQRLLIRGVSKTGLVTFAGSRDGIELPLQASVTAEERALSFVDLYGAAFGLADRSQLQRIDAPKADDLGITHARFQQVYQGIPIRAAEFFVHMKGTRVMSANGRVIDDLPVDLTPAVAPAAALDAARTLVEKYRPAEARGASYLTPRLEIFNKGVLADGTYPSRLAWFVEATNLALREYIWIDAQTGANLLNFSQLPHAKSRSVYTAGGTDMVPGTLRRSEGGVPVGDVDTDRAYLYAGTTYDYFFSTHGRDSFDNAGGAIISTVHYDDTPGDGESYGNAFWSGIAGQMVYGDGYASADDVVAHELTHAVTEHSADLLYYYQSGALNESMSDVFGETVDIETGNGNDTAGVRWLMGEDLPIGAIRNMMNPNLGNDPGKMSDSAQFRCVADGWTNPNGDSGGVHTNSGVPNHAYALTVDGGTYNGRTVTGIGLLKAAKIWYRALTVYLTSGSTFLDSYNALIQSCSDLTGTNGITAANCTQVTTALQAVEMNQPWGCAGAVQAPALCPSGTLTTAYFDGAEASNANWVFSQEAGAGGGWGRITGLAKSGTVSYRGTTPVVASVHSLSMNAGVVVPAGGRAYFDSAFEFESSAGVMYDGGVLQISTNGGSSWNDAGGLIDAGRTYNGATHSTNPLGTVSAFTGTSFGYTGTRLNLTSLAGQSIRLRFRIGTDVGGSSLGWFVDNIRIYTCITTPPPVPPSITANPGSLTRKAGASASFSASASGTPAPTVQWQVSPNGSSWSNIAGATSTTYALTATAAQHDKRFRAVFTNSASSATTSPAILTVRSVSGSDFNGDATTDLALFRPAGGTWLVRNQSSVQHGQAGDVPVAGDYNGDNTTDIAVFRPSTGEWLVRNQTTVQFGDPGDVPVPADYNGDGTTDIAVYRPLTGEWRVRNQPAFTVQFGGAGYIPIAGDFNGDGSDDVAVFQPKTGTWSVRNQFNLQYGEPGDVPAPADYNGDGSDDVAVFRPATGQWLVRNQFVVSYGSVGDRPMPRDYNGDGTTDIAVYRRATGEWFVRNQFTIQFGEPADIPAPRGPSLARAVGGDFDGNGSADVSVFRQSTGQWFVRNRFALQFGDPTDKAVPADYDGDGVIDVAVYRPSTGPVVRAQPVRRAVRRPDGPSGAGRLQRRRSTRCRGVPAVDRHVVRAQRPGVPVRRQRRHPGAGRLQRRWDRRPRGLPAVDAAMVRARHPRACSSATRAICRCRATTTATA